MKDYSNMIAFEQDVNIAEVSRALNLLGVKCEIESCYTAVLKEEISQTLGAYDIKETEENINKVLDSLECNNHIWDSVEESVKESVESNSDWEV